MKVLYRILQFLMIDHVLALVLILVTGMEDTSDEMAIILLSLIPSFLILAVATAIIRGVLLRFRCTECKTVFKPDRKERFFALHMFGKRRLYCPCCGRKRWCKGII